jgi:hypothetical protein
MHGRTMLVMKAVLFSMCVTLLHARTIYNETDYPLYVAGYHAGKEAERKIGPLAVEPGEKVDIDVPSTALLSTKTRYLVVARTPNALWDLLSLPQLKEYPHKSLTINKLNDFYLADKEGRLKMYNELEHSSVVKLVKQVTSSVKDTIVDVVINREKLAAVKNNPHRSDVAIVRVGNTLAKAERSYLKKRAPKVKAGFEKLLGKSLKGKTIPKIALVLSGGGDRAMFASCGYMQGAQEIGLLDAVTYIAALSGSTWFLGAWFASGQSNLSVFKDSFMQKMRKGITSVAGNEANLITDALKVKIAYNEPITMMDVFGALVGNVVLDEFGDNRQIVPMSDQAKLIDSGRWPLPIYTAVDGSKQTHQLHYWYEFTPYEVGGAWLGHYIPTWAFGRKFSKGTSQTDDPEISLSFLFGIFGSAFAVDTERMWKEVLKVTEKASALETPIRKLILNKIGDNRVTQAEEFNFTAGMPSSPLRDQSKMIFIDAGFAFGLPYPVVSGERPERAPEILIFVEASENVAKLKEDAEQGTSGLRAAAKYAKDKGLKFPTIDTITSNAITIYRDENDPTVPLVIWMPLVKDQEKWRIFGTDPRFANIIEFEVSSCVQKGFCPSVNFTYKPEQAQQLISLGQFNMHACKQDIIDAIRWKMDHM